MNAAIYSSKRGFCKNVNFGSVALAFLMLVYPATFCKLILYLKSSFWVINFVFKKLIVSK